MRAPLTRAFVSSPVLWSVVTVAAAIGRIDAAEADVLPRCAKGMKIIHAEPAPPETMHPATGRVVIEFTVDVLGYVSDPRVVESSNPRLDQEALRTVVLWRYIAPAARCRHETSITYQVKSAEDA